MRRIRFSVVTAILIVTRAAAVHGQDAPPRQFDVTPSMVRALGQPVPALVAQSAASVAVSRSPAPTSHSGRSSGNKVAAGVAFGLAGAISGAAIGSKAGGEGGGFYEVMIGAPLGAWLGVWLASR